MMLRIKSNYFVVVRNVNDIRITPSDVVGAAKHKVGIEFTNGSVTYTYIDDADKELLEFSLAKLDVNYK